jgi:hypothetical protein
MQAVAIARNSIGQENGRRFGEQYPLSQLVDEEALPRKLVKQEEGDCRDGLCVRCEAV